VLTPQIFTRARDSQRHASEHQKWGRGRSPPQKKNKGKHLKFGLKYSVFAPVTLALVTITSRNLKIYQATYREAGVLKWVQPLEGQPPTKFESAKNVQYSARFRQLSTWIANISGTYRHDENMKSALSTAALHKKLVDFDPLTKKVIGVTVDPPKLTIFQETIFRLLGGAAASNFYTCFNPLNCISSQTCDTVRPQVGLCSIFLVNTIAHMFLQDRQHYLRKVCYRYGPRCETVVLFRVCF